LRPAVGGGFTPFVGLRFGGSVTKGSYLDSETPVAGLFGRAWSDYQQTIIAGDVEYSRGYFDAHLEGARGTYQVPAGRPHRRHVLRRGTVRAHTAALRRDAPRAQRLSVHSIVVDRHDV